MDIVGTRGYPSYYGGFETAVRKLAPYLADQGWEVSVFGRSGLDSSATTDGDPRINSIVTRGIDTKQLSTLSYGFTSMVRTAIRKPDVALVMNVANGFWLPLLRLRGIPTLVNVDGIEWDRAKWGRLAKAMFKLGARCTARWANELVFDAKAIGTRWQTDFQRDGTFIPYGGDETPIDLPVEPGLTARKYVLLVARFVPENTVREFFAAVPSLAEQWDVVIVGSSGYGGELDELAKQLDDNHPRVRWLGHVRDDARLLSLWSNAGAYFHGHSVGGTNPALVQAMAAGAPVVARDTVYNREVLGNNALFVDADSVVLSEAVMRMMQREDVAEVADTNRARAREHYSWPDVCASYHSALLALTRGRREKDS
ncbi:glycosyltransferase [Microbacterium testaceum]|uniref:glycosyltransferase n=1 Tax=Microbacterium testaceum TaxID=2033 RepID=UPI00215664AF|nr:glycosyltransferase [Microbacterium testaceum]MDZ5145474.1 glycosyltransferase [Microbacterium testaceum]